MYNLVAHKIIMFDIFRDVKTREEKTFINMWGIYFPVFPVWGRKGKELQEIKILEGFPSLQHLTPLSRASRILQRETRCRQSEDQMGRQEKRGHLEVPLPKSTLQFHEYLVPLERQSGSSMYQGTPVKGFLCEPWRRFGEPQSQTCPQRGRLRDLCGSLSLQVSTIY